MRTIKTIEVLISETDARLSVGTERNRFTARMHFGDKFSALAAYGDSIEEAISNLEDSLTNLFNENNQKANSRGPALR